MTSAKPKMSLVVSLCVIFILVSAVEATLDMTSESCKCLCTCQGCSNKTENSVINNEQNQVPVGVAETTTTKTGPAAESLQTTKAPVGEAGTIQEKTTTQAVPAAESLQTTQAPAGEAGTIQEKTTTQAVPAAESLQTTQAPAGVAGTNQEGTTKGPAVVQDATQTSVLEGTTKALTQFDPDVDTSDMGDFPSYTKLSGTCATASIAKLKVTMAQCAEKCDKDAACVGFVYLTTEFLLANPGWMYCYLKSSMCPQPTVAAGAFSFTRG